MADQRFVRRHVLKGAAALGGVGVLAGLKGPVMAQADATRGIEGSWMVDVISSGPFPPPFKALMAFDAGGGMVETDQRSEISTGPFSPGHGTWVKVDERQFRATYPCGQARTCAPAIATRTAQTATIGGED